MVDDSPDLPDWALSIWESLGKPDVCEDVLTGPLLDRRTGMRRDDLAEAVLGGPGGISELAWGEHEAPRWLLAAS